MPDVSAPPGPWFWTLADSELASVTLDADGQTLTLDLAAAHLKHPAHGGPGHARGLRLVLTRVQLRGALQPGRLRSGRLWLGHGQGWQSGCAVPGVWQAAPGHPLQLEWEGAWGDPVHVLAATVQAGFVGDGLVDWRPWLHC